MSYLTVPLSQMMRRWSPEVVGKYLSQFECDRDRDLALFLHDRAIEFEKRDLARTFLLVREKQIIGYFSLANTVLEIREEWPVSNTLKKKMNAVGGPSAAFLIGQMCKANGVVDKIGPVMIEMALMMFDGVREICGGRVVCVDCKGDLLEFYKKNGFKIINGPSEEGLYRLALLLQ